MPLQPDNHPGPLQIDQFDPAAVALQQGFDFAVDDLLHPGHPLTDRQIDKIRSRHLPVPPEFVKHILNIVQTGSAGPAGFAVIGDFLRRPEIVFPGDFADLDIGHAEADIAMTELFGGFRPDFYATYKEVNLLQPGYVDRRDLYNLYHLLNHLNLFGAGYLGSVQKIVRRYAG